MPNQSPPRIYVYLRVSTDQQKQSHDRTRAHAVERITELKLHGAALGFIIEEEESAVDCRYTDRPGFATIAQAINPGDHLIVEAKDRLDRDPIAMLNCLQWLERRKVILHCLGVSDRPLDLGDYQTQMMNFVDAMASFHYVHWLRQRTKDGLAYHKTNGFAHNKSLPPGRKKVTLPTKSAYGRRDPYRGLVWDEKQCEIIRDIKRMHEEQGMNFVAIGRLLRDRGLRTQSGGHWAHKRRKKLPNGAEWWDATSVRNVYSWYCELLASGKELGDVPLLQPAVPHVWPVRPEPLLKEPKPRKWKPWQRALLDKWATETTTASTASSSLEQALPSLAVCPLSEQDPFSTE